MADTNKMHIQNCGIRTPLVNIRHLKMMRRRPILWWRRTARASSGEYANAADTCIGWTCYYGSRKMQNAFALDYYRIIILYRYCDIFDLLYRLSIENSIWHIVTALFTTVYHTLSTMDVLTGILLLVCSLYPCFVLLPLHNFRPRPECVKLYLSLYARQLHWSTCWW